MFSTVPIGHLRGRTPRCRLVATDDYETASSRASQASQDSPAGVLVQTSGLHIRGVDRKQVVIDGALPGSPAGSSSPSDQNYGPAGSNGQLGLNGILVWKADKVWVQNMTVCNFLAGNGERGNEIWWNRPATR